MVIPNIILVLWFCDTSLSNLDIQSLSVIYFEHLTCGKICYLFIYLFIHWQNLYNTAKKSTLYILSVQC